MDPKTLIYYQQNAQQYAAKTATVDMSYLQRKFLGLLPDNSVVVDLGCGGGRDLRVFQNFQHLVIGIDLAFSLCKIAHETIEMIVHSDIRQLPIADSSVDAIWCCASLLHFTKQELPGVFQEIARIAKSQAVFMISLKEGQGEIRDSENRYFSLFTEEEIRNLLQQQNFVHIAFLKNVGIQGQSWITAICQIAKDTPEHTNVTIQAARIWGHLLLDFLPEEEKTVETDMLLEHILEVDSSFLFSYPQKHLTLPQQQAFFAAIAQRKQHCPLAYIIGKKGFMSLNFWVTTEVLIPRPETELIVEKVIELFGAKNFFGLDIGTGSGCIAVSILKYCPQAHMVASDIALESLKVAQKNADLHQVQERIFLTQGDLFTHFAQQQFDVIVSNPPYISEDDYRELMPEIHQEPKRAFVAADGFYFYEKILQQAQLYLKEQGYLLLEIGYQQMETVVTLATQSWKIVEIIDDYAGIPRVLVLQKTEPCKI